MEIIFLLIFICLSKSGTGRYILVDLSVTEDGKNVKAKKPPSFYINKETISNRFTWVAVLDPSTPEVLGELNAERGECNGLETDEGSQRCGIGRALMELCFKDDDITENGGVDPLNSIIWKDQQLGPTAKDVCASIVHVGCEPVDPDALLPVCKMYIEAARYAGYRMMFVGDLGKKQYHRFRIDRGYQLFTTDPESFSANQGIFWLFCKCKPTKRKECLALDITAPETSTVSGASSTASKVRNLK